MGARARPKAEGSGKRSREVKVACNAGIEDQYMLSMVILAPLQWTFPLVFYLNFISFLVYTLRLFFIICTGVFMLM